MSEESIVVSCFGGSMGELFSFVASFVMDFFRFKHRGYAQPDDPDRDDGLIITGPSDAMAQKIIDQATSRKKKV